MKEITRIHIAKIPYDIEIAAKKELEKYIKTLELYANDSELLNDIEIRITELLAERGVGQSGVIGLDDVKAVQSKLGDPEEFKDESEEVRSEETIPSGRRLYRDADGAVLGGVLSGIAKFFSIDPLWTRIIFVLLLFLTGFFPIILVYGILWLVIPPAKTAAEKLQMGGKPVTLAQIRGLNEDENTQAQEARAETARRVIGTFAGIIGICFTLASFAVTIVASVALISGYRMHFFNAGVPIDYGPEWPYFVAFVLASASGILLTSFFALLSYASFARKFTKRIALAIVIIVIAGITSFTLATGLVAYREYAMSQEIDRKMDVKSAVLPSEFKNATTLKTAFSSANVKYVVDNTARIEYKAVAGSPAPVMTVEGSVATLSYPKNDIPDYSKAHTHITVYGPKLDIIDSDSTHIEYVGGTGGLDVRMKGWAQTTLAKGTFQKLSAHTSSGSSLIAGSSTVKDVELDLVSDHHSVQLGIVNTLTITQVESCPADSSAELLVAGITSGSYSYNGVTKPVDTINDNSCLQVIYDKGVSTMKMHSYSE